MTGKISNRVQRERELDRLLAKGRIAGPERDRILDAVIYEHSSDPPERHRAGLLWVKVATASALCLIIALPTVWYLTSSNQPGMRIKGASDSEADVAVGCDGPCTSGSTLIFRVTDLAVTAHLSAYALDAEGRRIWYFPSNAGASPKVAVSATPIVLKKGVMIGPEHQPGTYEVHIIMSREFLSRDVLRSLAQEPGDERILGHWVRRIEIK